MVATSPSDTAPAPGGPALADDAGPADSAAAERVVGSLSPSRAADFMTCPLRYRFRVIDRLPEPPSPPAVRGTLVHGVLERLFELAPTERTLVAAQALLEPQWARLLSEEPDLGGLFPDGAALAAWLATAGDLLAGYFELEDPTRLAPAARELYVEHVLPGGLRLRGYLDRLDAAGSGAGEALRVVDYKTGRSPGQAFEASALFQMKFYALLLWRTRGVVPRELRLYYLGDRVLLHYAPDERDLLATERKVWALWAAIERAHRTGDWRASPSRLCDWCDHQSRCPAFGGTPPPLPVDPGAAMPAEPAPSVCEPEG